jgi:hypothetical protein
MAKHKRLALPGRKVRDDCPQLAGRRIDRLWPVGSQDAAFQAGLAQLSTGIVKRDPIHPTHRRIHASDPTPSLERAGKGLVGRILSQCDVAEGKR